MKDVIFEFLRKPGVWWYNRHTHEDYFSVVPFLTPNDKTLFDSIGMCETCKPKYITFIRDSNKKEEIKGNSFCFWIIFIATVGILYSVIF